MRSDQLRVEGLLEVLPGTFGHPVAVVPDAALPPGLRTPRPAVLTSGARRLPVLLHRAGDILDAAPTVLEGRIALPLRLQHVLGLTAGDPVVLTADVGLSLTVRAARADDLPVGARVHVGTDALAELEAQGASGHRVLLLSGELQLPVRVEARPSVPVGEVRVSMLLRTLAGADKGSAVTLAPLPLGRDRHLHAAALRQRVGRWSSGPAGVALGLLVLLLRSLDLVLEHVLRPALLAPAVAVRTEQGQLGDDTEDVVRAHPALLASLGLPEQGGQAVLSWGRRRTAVLVAPDIPDDVAPSGHLGRHRASATTEHPRAADFPRHLLVRVSATSRQVLGMPPVTVVELRRRLRPLVLRQLNALLTPLLGLLLASVAIEGLPVGGLVAAGVAVVVLGLAPLRLSRPGRGLWP